MPGEKIWRLSTPFRLGLPGKQDLTHGKTKAERSRKRVSSVCLSDGSSSASSFVVIHDIDDPIGSQTTHEDRSYPSYPPKLSSSTDNVDSYPQTQQAESQRNLYLIGDLVGDLCHIPIANTSLKDDLAPRLRAAYEHIRSMPFVSPEVVFSSDVQMLRKQLGVPQHSVLNYPIYTSQLDLPNPHAPLHELTPSAASGSLDALRAESPEPSRDNPPLRRSAFGTLLSPCSSSSQSHVPNVSKLTKRRIEKSVVSSSERNALRATLRKSAVDILPSSTTTRKISLPQLRSPSPFRLDIPLHHSWHDRRTDFDFTSEHPVQPYGKKRRGTSGSTEILASLAWIGAPPVAPDPYTADQKRQRINSPSLPDHFSMAIAVEDDSISDEILVDRLERVRKSGYDGIMAISPSRPSDEAQLPSHGGDSSGSCDVFDLSSPTTSDRLAIPYGALLPSFPTPNNPSSDSEDTEVWNAARKALLCVREIIRTERKYQEALKILLDAQTVSPPPPSMLPYLSALVRASETLLKWFLEDPSAWGVSTAFVASEDELETSMVSWCAVAGTFFTDENDSRTNHSTGKWRIRKLGVPSSSSFVGKQVSTSLGPQLPPIFASINPSSEARMALTEYRPKRHKREGQTSFVSRSRSSNGLAPAKEPPGRRPSVRDVAIQPVQRVMRYVLLYKDLLDCTPSASPSYLLVERALEAATRIASHCDSAQRNPAFYRAS